MKKIAILLVLVMITSTMLIGCGTNEKVDEAAKQATGNSGESAEVTENEPVTEVSNDIKDQAEKEGVSVRELENTLDGLAQLSADKYGMSKEEYIKDAEACGETILSEWQLASENMGMSITEIYQYEKAKGDHLTDEQKETMAGMNDALKMAEAELAKIENTEVTDVENMLGIYGNDTGEVRVVTLTDDELREALTVDTYKVLQDYIDEYSVNYEYVTNASYDDITEHYISLVENTEEYLKLEPVENMGVMLQGTINETLVYIEIDNSDPGKIRVSTYLDLSSKA